MKNIILIGLFCMALTFSACSSSSKGGYVGEAEIISYPQVGNGEETKAVYDKVFALLTEEGGGTIEFTDTSAITNCKIQLESLAEGNHREFGKGQTCEAVIGGAFTVNLVILNNYTKDGGKMFITIFGQTSGTKTRVNIKFTGEPYKKK